MTPGIITRTDRLGRPRRLAAAGVVLACMFGGAADARAQKLGIQGDRFTIDGTPKFLTFVTYFGGMGAPNVIADLHLMKTLGFDGFRIWPLLDTGPQILNGDGSLRATEISTGTAPSRLAARHRDGAVPVDSRPGEAGTADRGRDVHARAH